MKRHGRRSAKPITSTRKLSSRPEPASTGLTLRFRSNPRLLAVVRGAAERLAEVLGFSAGEQRSIVRALDEAVSNIIRHCYRGQIDQPIAVQFRPLEATAGSKAGLEIVLTDQGPPVNFAKLQGRELSDVRPGGLGLHLIRQSMESVEYSRSNGRNRLRLVKYKSGQPAQTRTACG